jgi:hypothetical protein
MMKPGGKLTEAIGFGIFALAAGNIMVYTVQCFKATYERPPLSVWQKGAGEKPTPGSESPGGKGNEKGKGGGGEGLAEELLVDPTGPNPLLNPLAPLQWPGKIKELFGG